MDGGEGGEEREHVDPCGHRGCEQGRKPARKTRPLLLPPNLPPSALDSQHLSGSSG